MTGCGLPALSRSPFGVRAYYVAAWLVRGCEWTIKGYPRQVRKTGWSALMLISPPRRSSPCVAPGVCEQRACLVSKVNQSIPLVPRPSCVPYFSDPPISVPTSRMLNRCRQEQHTSRCFLSPSISQLLTSPPWPLLCRNNAAAWLAFQPSTSPLLSFCTRIECPH